MTALDYIAAGLAVIPLRPRSKRPLIAWKQFATTAPSRDQVTTWLRAYPGANWAVLLGPVSGSLVVLDFDDVASFECWAMAWPDVAQAAPAVTTARGRHVYLVGTPGQRTAKLLDYAGEVKGAGGYVLLPPSVHPSGARYRWLHGDLTRYVPQIGDLRQIGIRTQEAPARETPAHGFPTERTPRSLKPCTAAVIGGTTDEGRRNVTAWRLALHLRSEGWSEAATLYLLADWAARSGTPKPELARTVQSAYRPERTPGHGCKSPELSPFCNPLCPLARWVVRHDHND